MKTIFDHLVETHWRVAQTVPLALHTANNTPHRTEFWLNVARQERGHDTILRDDLTSFFGEDVCEAIESFTPSKEMLRLISWVMESELNHLAYKWVLEALIVSPHYDTLYEFYEKIMPNFMQLHRELDVDHSLEAATLLKEFDQALVLAKIEKVKELLQ